MNVLIVGGGQGSWQIRGIQLGTAIGARTTSNPSDAAIQWADVVVCVKRALFEWADKIHAFKKPIVWDALDFWDQPEQNSLSEVEARALLSEKITRHKPLLVIGATQSMAAACRGVYLPHHERPGMVAAKRDQREVIAYEGTAKYLGRWRGEIEEICERRGWSFTVNGSLSTADLVVALRDGQHDGWMCREWKSGVKLVNALALGLPVITQASAAWREIQPDGWLVNTLADLPAVLHRWAERSTAHYTIESRVDYSLTHIAARYTAILSRVGAKVAA
jgi:hypothetical protein